MATEEKTILRVYGAFAATLLFMLAPHIGMCLVAMLMMLGTMVAAYTIRRKSEPHSLATDHMTFIIRTLWIGSGMALITTAIASAYMLLKADMMKLAYCMNDVVVKYLHPDNPPTTPEQIDAIGYNEAIVQCSKNFMNDNAQVLAIAVVIAAGAPMLYFAYRLAKGLSRARKGHRLGNVKSWL